MSLSVSFIHPTSGEDGMNKLKLMLEDLQIESFSTTPGKKEKGTVYGEQCTCYTACTCPGCPTCDASCADTCQFTCFSWQTYPEGEKGCWVC
jgi:hypothetical protein